MVWNKTPQHVLDAIEHELRTTFATNAEIAAKLGVKASFVNEYSRKLIPRELSAQRISEMARRSKLEKNHMRGRKGELHQRYNPDSRTAGYLTSLTPEGWAGGLVAPNRVYRHHAVWAKYYGQNRIPKGCVIHHIDMDIDNNDITNLQLLTISEHMKLHQEIRKVQRLSREGVGNSVPEAPTAPEG